MSNDYHDAVDDARLNAAAMDVLGLSLAACPIPVHDLAARVVTETFCSCVTEAEDACEGRLSTIHAELIAEVVRRVEAVVAVPSPTAATRSARGCRQVSRWQAHQSCRCLRQGGRHGGNRYQDRYCSPDGSLPGLWLHRRCGDGDDQGYYLLSPRRPAA